MLIVPGGIFPGNPAKPPHVRVANPAQGGDNRWVDSVEQKLSASPGRNPFQPGAMVVVTLGSPREKFWGAILSLTAEGISLRGIELASFDDLVAMVKEGEPFSPGVVFFSMHRVERMELDMPDGSIPSLAQRFTAKTGLDPASLLYPGEGSVHRPEERS